VDGKKEFKEALAALEPASRKPTAADLIRANIGAIRDKKAAGVPDLALLDLVNSEARSPIKLVTFRCYVARMRDRAPKHAVSVRQNNGLTPQRDELETKPAGAGARITASFASSTTRTARIETRGVTHAVAPPPVE